jgi:hypothetical protein
VASQQVGRGGEHARQAAAREALLDALHDLLSASV